MYGKDIITLANKDHWFLGKYNNCSLAFHISDYLLCEHMQMNVIIAINEILSFLLMGIREWSGRDIDNELLNK